MYELDPARLCFRAACCQTLGHITCQGLERATKSDQILKAHYSDIPKVACRSGLIPHDSAARSSGLRFQPRLQSSEGSNVSGFSLDEVIPEFTADVGTKKGKKVDFVLQIDGKIAMLIEAKPISMTLGNTQVSQLFRYFAVTNARVRCLSKVLSADFMRRL